jgi:hypothetical protein
LQSGEDYSIFELFSNGKTAWTLDRGSVMTSPVFGLTVAPGHDGSPVMTQWSERSTGSPARASPGCGRRRGGRVTTVKKWRWRRSMRAAFGRGEKRRQTGRDEVEDGEASATLTQAQQR